MIDFAERRALIGHLGCAIVRARTGWQIAQRGTHPGSKCDQRLEIVLSVDETLPARTPLHRAHRLALGPVFFGPGPGAPPTYRFDSASSAFGVLYVALEFPRAIVETLLRNPRRKMVAEVGGI